MVVRSNIAAMNANRNLNKNNNGVSKSLEKLSSGFKINRAGDDASGLAISEKMKAQIKALDTASANAEDGISLIQTAEGYLGEIHDQLNRMVELAEKSANGINEDNGKTGGDAYGIGDYTDSAGGTVKGQRAGTDRAALQAEMDQLSAEIDRIAITANFNGNKLFNGAMENGSSTVIGEKGSQIAGVKGKALTLQIGETSNKADKLAVSLKRMTTDNLFSKMSGTVSYIGNDGKETTTTKMLIDNGAGANSNTLTVGARDDGNTDITQGQASAYQSGKTINISDQAIASKAAELIRDAIDNVSSQRGDLGAMQNRLEYTINNLNTASENMNSANSRIRDTDMAKEMMKYTSGNVLTQAAQAMLAQANTKTQSVLQLLQ
ncbi:MAG: flagellin [Oscillospiraceae bacterium]